MSLFAVLFIFSYSCQDGENNQIENPQTQGIKKSSPAISDCDLPYQEIQFKRFLCEMRDITDAVTASYGIEDFSFYWKIDFFRAPDANPHFGDIATHISEDTKDSMLIVMAAHPNLLSDLTYFVVEHLAWKPHTFFQPTDEMSCDIDNILIEKCYAENRGIGEYTELLFDYYYPLTDRKFLYAESPNVLTKVDSIPNYGVINYYILIKIIKAIF